MGRIFLELQSQDTNNTPFSEMVSISLWGNNCIGFIFYMCTGARDQENWHNFGFLGILAGMPLVIIHCFQQDATLSGTTSV